MGNYLLPDNFSNLNKYADTFWLVPSTLLFVDTRSVRRCDLTDGLKLLQVKTVKIHHFCPRRRKVSDELFLSVVASVNFGEGAEFRV